MTNEGAKEHIQHLLQAQQALVCLCSISETPQSHMCSTACSPSKLFPGWYAGVRRSSADFRPFDLY